MKYLLVRFEHFFSLFAEEHEVVVFEPFWDWVSAEWFLFQQRHFFSFDLFSKRSEKWRENFGDMTLVVSLPSHNCCSNLSALTLTISLNFN